MLGFGRGRLARAVKDGGLCKGTGGGLLVIGSLEVAADVEERCLVIGRTSVALRRR